MLKKPKIKKPVPDMSFDLTPPASVKKKKKVEPEIVASPTRKKKKIVTSVFDDDEMDAPPAPKKKKPGTALAIPQFSIEDDPPPDKGGKISKLKVSDNLTSILGDDAEMLQQLLETGESDSALMLLNKRLLQSSVDLIANVESGVRESKGRYGVHSFNGLVQTIRELMLDMQATKDRGAMGTTLVENILRPAMLDIAMAVMNEYATVANDLKDSVDDNTYKQFRNTQIESRTRLASLMQSQYEKMRDETVKFLER